jgi:hypothetical protein
MTVLKEDAIKVPNKEQEGRASTPPEEEEQVVKPFPNAFYCPITKDLMEDPVVIPDGDSYERSAILETGDVSADKLYLNRALQSIIDEEVETSGDSMQAGLMRLQRTIGKSLRQLMDKSAIPTLEFRPLPDAYYCPITFGIIHDPVIDPEGNTFERVAVEYWIQANDNSPITRTSLTVEDLYPNKALAELLEEEKCRDDETMHPSIREWKLEAPPTAVVATDPESGAAASTPSQFPTTPTELEQNQRRERHAVCNVIGILLLFGILMLAGLSFGVWLIIFIITAICCCVSRANARAMPQH